ncbi:MAG: hypothetical protein MJ232_09165 [archaeon]|nr:hypothetical protein [archaeon]
MDFTKQQIEEAYVNNSRIHGDININNKKSNKAAKELMKLNKYLKENIDIAKDVIDDLFIYPDINTQIWISALAIDINYKSEESINFLLSTGNNLNIGILAMNARLRLADRMIKAIDEW